MNLTELFTSIANAIRSKKGTTELINAVDFPSEIANLPSGSTSSAKITDGSYLFYKGARTDYVNELLSMCENISSANSMFDQCSNLTELDVSNLDMKNVKSMYYMFGNCSKVTELDVSNFDTSNVTDMEGVFYGCSKVTELDVSNWNTSNVTTLSGTFCNCYSLTKLDVSNWNTSNVTKTTNVFGSCRELTELDLSTWDMSKNIYPNYMFGTLTLTNLRSFKNLGKGYTQKTTNYSNYRLDISNISNLNKESIIDVITNGLYDLYLTYDVANGGTLYTQQLKLGSTKLSKLTAEEIAIATNKGWTVS